MSLEKDIQLIQSRLSDMENHIREAEKLRDKIHQQRQFLESKIELSDSNKLFLSDNAQIVSLREFSEIRRHAVVQKFQLNELLKDLKNLEQSIEKKKQEIEKTKQEIRDKKALMENNIVPFKRKSSGQKTN